MSLPKSYKRIVATELSSDFRKVTKIEEVQLKPDDIKDDDVVVRVYWSAINASDVNFIAGRYDPSAKPPLYPGFEAVGQIVFKGKSVAKLNVGQPVVILGYGCFSEYIIVNHRKVSAIPELKAEYSSLWVSGLTASLALEQLGHMKSGETVLVTAAAGGTGHFAVQLAKIAGNHVIGTCSSDDKVKFLKDLGCDRVINYKKENLFQVLKKEYPKGIDIVYESVGGDIFDTCVNNLAIKGRLIVIGFISGYQNQSGWSEEKGGSSKKSDTSSCKASTKICHHQWFLPESL